ncbi:MAG TPA: hypothetical protein VL400_04840 [Polyangiaceae bacterium]|nr:hypothetical protein [Polyangiaceae bacterium]
MKRAPGARHRPPSDEVAVVAHTRETLEGLEEYLRTAGFSPRCTRFLGHPNEMVPGACKLVVLFPDDFPRPAVEGALADLGARALRVLLVTGEPRHFDAWVAADQSTRLVLPKPAWAWTITDAIRAWLDAPPQEPRLRKHR